MKDLKNENIILEVIDEILNEADELLIENSNTDFDKGKILAYATVLDIIKDTLSGYDLKEFNLDFDVEKKYLGIEKS